MLVLPGSLTATTVPGVSGIGRGFYCVYFWRYSELMDTGGFAVQSEAEDKGSHSGPIFLLPYLLHMWEQEYFEYLWEME